MYGVKFNDNQKRQILNAVKKKKGVQLTLNITQFVRLPAPSGSYDFKNFTKTQIDKIKVASGSTNGARGLKATSPIKLNLSYSSLRKDGGFLGAILPFLASAAKYVLPALATGILSGTASGLANRVTAPKRGGAYRRRRRR